MGRNVISSTEFEDVPISSREIRGVPMKDNRFRTIYQFVKEEHEYDEEFPLYEEIESPRDSGYGSCRLESDDTQYRLLWNDIRWRLRSDDTQGKLQKIIAITALKELRKELDIVCVGTNYGKVVAIGAILFSGVASILGGVMVFRKPPLAVTAMSVGSLLYNSGAFVEALSNFIDLLALVHYKREVGAILRNDRERAQPQNGQEYLEFLLGFNTNIQVLFPTDLKSDVFKGFSESIVIINSRNGFYATLDSMNKGQYPMLTGIDVEMKSLLEIFEKTHFSDLLDIVGKLRTSLTVLIVAVMGVKIYRDLFNDSASTTESLPTNQMSKVSANADGVHVIQDDRNVELASYNNAERPLVGAVSAFMTFQAIATVSRVFPLISASMVIRNGKSMYSDAIDTIIYWLKDELRSM